MYSVRELSKYALIWHSYETNTIPPFPPDLVATNHDAYLSTILKDNTDCIDRKAVLKSYASIFR
jgi:hypothetical protein